MKPQTRKGALIETTVNLMVGFAISYALNFFLLPWWTGATPTTASLLGLGGAFTLASVVRQYVLRRVFERLRIRKAPPDFLYIMVEVADERTRQISGRPPSGARALTVVPARAANGSGSLPPAVMTTGIGAPDGISEPAP